MTIAVSRVESKASDREASGAPAQPASSDNNSIAGATIRFSVSALPTIFIRRLSTCHSRSEEHTSELQSLMRSSYAVFCLKKKMHSTLHIQHNKVIRE